jgi:hypothetical protein
MKKYLTVVLAGRSRLYDAPQCEHGDTCRCRVDESAPGWSKRWNSPCCHRHLFVGGRGSQHEGDGEATDSKERPQPDSVSAFFLWQQTILSTTVESVSQRKTR